jgi:Flp pilus assembly protein CpaB
MTPTTLFGLMAALAVFVLVIVLLQDRREMVTVAMTSERVPAGATITEGMVERAEVPASVRFSGDLVPFEEAVGSTASRTLQPGEPVPRSAVGARNESSGARVMAIPVTSWQAAGGELDVGDRVDVIDGDDFVLVRSTGATDDATAAPAPPAATTADAPSPGSVPTGSAPTSGGG